MTKTIAIVSILILMVVLIGLKEPKDTQQALPDIPSFEVADVAVLSIINKGQPTFSASKQGEAWLLRDGESPRPVNKDAVEQLLYDLQSMKPKRVVSRKTERFQTFSVVDSEVILKNKQGRVLLDVFVGKPATDLTSTYLRFADSKLVMTVNKVLTWQVKRTQDAWLLPTKVKEVPSE